jgi:hypothetical protein
MAVLTRRTLAECLLDVGLFDAEVGVDEDASVQSA